MKIEISVNITPEELRTFLGLPDVKGFQDEAMAKMRERMIEGTEVIDPAALMAPFLTSSSGALESMQRAFWQAFSDAATKAQSGGSEEK